MGAETCKRCGRAVLQQLCVGKADGECGAWVSTMPEWRAECLLVAYTRQRARADAAERERDAERATIATLREEVERLKQELARRVVFTRPQLEELRRGLLKLGSMSHDMEPAEYARLMRVQRGAMVTANTLLGLLPEEDAPPQADPAPPQASTTTQGGEG